LTLKSFIDEKGKLFTDLVEKRAVPVVVQTLQHTIQGEIFILPEDRLIDDLNGSGHFLAITGAVVFSLAGEELYRSSFLALNRDHIVWTMPTQELTKAPAYLEEADRAR
jgi:hypothetical protein